MNFKILLFINLLIVINQVECGFEIRKLIDRVYEIYDETTYLAKLQFKFINVAVLVEVEWSENANNFLIEFVLREKRSPNDSIIIRAKKSGSNSEIRLYLLESNKTEVELDCYYYSLINKPTNNKVGIKLSPNLRFNFKSNQPFIVNNNVRNLEINLFRLSFFGNKKLSTKSVSNYQLVYNDQNELLEDLFCLKGDEIERPIFFESNSIMFLFIFLFALIFALITLIFYYIFKVRKYRINI